ncbi:hypothetical protein [Phytoactinopolyspora mesophila]|uniref:hypothetical protein n=1 Tax=Phytoactinopolyspora mesophila TaxID=2650750 RepID=UPI0016520096|nr:hypothetical protein [Phytoactinopolyspora mesophila]
MPCYRCGAREADPARGARLWVRAVRSDVQVLVCPDCQQSSSWSTEVDHCSACNGTNLVRRLGQTVCRSCESSATAEFLAVESTMDRGIAVGAAPGKHRRPDDGRDLTAEVATALDRVLGRHAKRPPEDGDAGAEFPAPEPMQYGDHQDSSPGSRAGPPRSGSEPGQGRGRQPDDKRNKGARFRRNRQR